MTINETKLNEFLGKAVGDLGAGVSAALVVIGDKLGLYKAMAAHGPVTPTELAKATGTHERYIREWLGNQAAGGYVTYDAATGKYTLPEEQALCLTNEYGNVFFPGAFQIVLAAQLAMPRTAENFKSGEGIAWGDQDASLFEGTERFFRPNYIGNLTGSWIPALTGAEGKLKEGGRVADVGCGLGASTIIMAKAYPKSQFIGYDYHPRSIELARQRAKESGAPANVRFEVGSANDFPGQSYDLITNFDCLHDMVDPVGASKHAWESLKSGGSWMIVEPFANDHVEDNLNPVGRLYYGASTLLCVPCSLAGHGPALGAQAGEARTREVVSKGGFKDFRRATQTPFNLIYEARR